MNVRDLIRVLQAVENKDVHVYAAVGDATLLVTSVETYDDAVEIWTVREIKR
jgi:hypothetical protein